LGYLATSGATSDVIFLLSDPDFLYGWRNFARISRVVSEIWRGTDTTDNRQTRRPKQKALTLSVRACLLQHLF